MKLGELRQAIRKDRTGIAVLVVLNGQPAAVLVQKSSLDSALAGAFDAKTAETGLELVDGVLQAEGGASAGVRPEAQTDIEDYITNADEEFDEEELL